MTLTELKYIVAVARERHFGRAAESCFISQPSLSVAVRKLEDELGVHLFERRFQEISLTPIGEAIVEQAQKVLDEVHHIEEIALQGQDPLCGPLRLGVIFTISPYLMPGLVHKMLELAPKMPLILTENYTGELLVTVKTSALPTSYCSAKGIVFVTKCLPFARNPMAKTARSPACKKQWKAHRF